MFRFIFTALAGLLVACTQNSAEVNTPKPTLQVSQAANNKAISVTRHGNPNGQTLIFIPGLASSAAVWDETIEASPNYDVRVVQLAGFAGMEAIQDPSIEGVRSAITNHLKDVPGRDVVMIGHSLGGFLTLKTALVEPELINEIIIVDSLPYLAGMMMPDATPEQATQMASAMSQQLKSLPREQFDAQQKMGLVRLVKDASYQPDLEAWSEASDQGTVATLMGELLASDLRESLDGFKIKTTVLMAYDPVMGVPEENLKALYEAQYNAAANVEIKVIGESYHFIMFDQPDAFKATLKNIING